jgi:hypothetical protein
MMAAEMDEMVEGFRPGPSRDAIIPVVGAVLA